MRNLVLLMAAAAIATPSFAAEPPALLIRDVRIFDGHRTSEHRSVLVRNGVIAAIGGPAMAAEGATVVPGAGRTLLPGIIDAHVHVSHGLPEKVLQQSARLGVTTVLDMFTNAATLKRIRELEALDSPDMADVRSSGVGATAPHGHPTEMDPNDPIPTLTEPGQAQAFVDARIAEGSDYIKIIYEDNSEFGGKAPPIPTLSPATIRAVVAAAHRRGKLAVVHVQTEAQARTAIEAGVDGLAHLFVGETASPDFGRFARAHHVFVVPTLSVMYLRCGRSDGAVIAADNRLMPQTFPEFTAMLKQKTGRAALSCAATDQAVRELRDAHVPILVGTDAPVPGSTYGASTLDEMALLVADGLTPTEALIAGTSAAAKAFRLADRGEVKVGKRADLLLVNGDPSANIDAVKDIAAVWKRGVPVPRRGGTPASAPAA
jgi:imidazolonepropionase-like amidohydrolase